MVLPKKYNSDTGGVDPISIEGRFYEQRERLRGKMTDEDRRRRLQWQKDQLLAPNEPVIVPELYLDLVNPIRRFLRKPLDIFFEKLNLTPRIGASNAHYCRNMTGSILQLIGFGYVATYYFMYNNADWTSHTGLYIKYGREMCLPGDPGYPKGTDRTKFSDYNDRDFKNSPI